jgi:cytochrome b6-f complex iron-sulfur subunit
MKRAVDRYIESLLRGRRPRPFAPSEDDLAMTRTAIALAAAGPDSHAPDQAFVDGLRRRIAAQQTAEAERSAASAPSHSTPAHSAPQHASSPYSNSSQPTRAVPARRRFLQATAVTAGAAAVGATADHLLTQRSSAPPSAAQGELTPVSGTWQTVAADADLPEGAVKEFDLGSVFGFVQRTSGRVQAVSGICTHQGCRLDLTTPADQLVCPCHGAVFSASGQPVSYPNSTYEAPPLPRLAVRVQAGSIQIYAPAPGSGSGSGTAGGTGTGSGGASGGTGAASGTVPGHYSST